MNNSYLDSSQYSCYETKPENSKEQNIIVFDRFHKYFFHKMWLFELKNHIIQFFFELKIFSFACSLQVAYVTSTNMVVMFERPTIIAPNVRKFI